MCVTYIISLATNVAQIQCNKFSADFYVMSRLSGTSTIFTLIKLGYYYMYNSMTRTTILNV